MQPYQSSCALKVLSSEKELAKFHNSCGQLSLILWSHGYKIILRYCIYLIDRVIIIIIKTYLYRITPSVKKITAINGGPDYKKLNSIYT